MTRQHVEAASEWSFNCGPGALCAVLDMTPEEIRPHLREFEQKGYTNPTLMASILSGLGVRFLRHYEAKGAAQAHFPRNPTLYPRFGLVRVQWGGPWTRIGVPIRARYRHTHWIAHRTNGTASGRMVFDVNAICVGGWIPWEEWADQLVPWLLSEAEPKASGEWWPTHSWEITGEHRARQIGRILAHPPREESQ